MDREKIKRRLFIWYSFLWFFIFLAIYIVYIKYVPEENSTISKWSGLAAGAIAILCAVCKNLEISFYDMNNNFLKRVINYFFNGAMIFFNGQNKMILILALIISFPLYKYLGQQYIVSFVAGIISSCSCVFVANYISTRTNAKISHSSFESFNSILKLAFNSGVVVATSILGFSIIGLVILFNSFKDAGLLCGYAFGATLVALFFCVSSVISKRACENAKHIVSGFFDEMQEKDRRNPLLLLSGISNSTFSLQVLCADIFQSFLLVIISAMLVGDAFYALRGMFLPIVITAGGIFSSVIVILLTKINKIKNPIKTMFTSCFFAIILYSVFSYFVIKTWLIDDVVGLTGSIVIGSFSGYIICFIGAANIFSKYKSVKNVANSAIAGSSFAFAQTLKESFFGVFAPFFLIAFLLITSFLIPGGIESPMIGFFGVTLSIMSVLTTIGVMVAINTFALVSNNINVVSGSYEEDYDVLPDDKISLLGQIGHNTIALGKNFINLTSMLAAISVVVTFAFITGIDEIDILNPYHIASLLVGCGIPFLYSSMMMGGVSKIASKLVFQVKKQFRNYPQILRHEMRPDYEKCVQIASMNSSIQVLVYTIIALIAYFLVAMFLGTESMIPFIIGVIFSSCGLIFASSNSSLISRSAKKYFENEFINAQYSEQYGAISAVDIVCSMVKDTISPCLNIFVKLIAILALIIAPFVVKPF